MRQDKFLTIREAAEELGISEQEVIELAEKGKIPAYKIGGVYLRFKPEQIADAKQRISRSLSSGAKVSWLQRLGDFLYFNDFYILAILVIILMLLVIFKT